MATDDAAARLARLADEVGAIRQRPHGRGPLIAPHLNGEDEAALRAHTARRLKRLEDEIAALRAADDQQEEP